MIQEDKLVTIITKLKNAISLIEKEENIKIDLNNLRKNSSFITGEISIKSFEDIEDNDKMNIYLSKKLGFTQNIIGFTFESKNEIHKIVEIKTKNRKYPIIVEKSDGSRYKYSTAAIKYLLGGDKIINRNKNLENLDI